MTDFPLNVVLMENGELRELYKAEDFGQISMRVLKSGRQSSGSRHMEKDEWWVVARGEAVVHLRFPDGTRELHLVSGRDPKIIRVPRGTGHLIKNTGVEDVVLLFHSSEMYDPDNPDKEDWSP